ncbi:MAG: PAS domain-containing protein, partial [Candidatus Eremiobacteraeota bacterium]|nr:PAS domain-containing protein [Candidatus Eremiobacteraeota bacterium]
MSALPGDLFALAVGALGGYLGGRVTRPGATPDQTRVEARDEAPRGDSFEDVLGALPVAAFVVDRRGRLVFSNRAADELFGIEASARDRALIEAIRSVELERLVRTAQGGTTAEGTIVLRYGDPEKTVAIKTLPIDRDGPSVLVIAEDRTEIAGIERVRRDFLADVSHELRTPISSIRLMVETIQLAGGEPEALRMFLPNIAIELERMTNLVEDLLELARNESRSLPLLRSRVDLREVVDDAVEAFRSRADVLGVDLSLLPGNAVEAEIDPERVQQVTTNLVENALRHTPPNGHVRVALEAIDGEALLRVEDDGEGIPFKDLP